MKSLRSGIDRPSIGRHAQSIVWQVKALAVKVQNTLVSASGKHVKIPRHSPSLIALAQGEACDPHRLEWLVPPIRTLEERVRMAERCRDADGLPKVINAGAVVTQPDGTQVQMMHNGIKVVAGGYYGAWMMDLITRCEGHHEPQEEVLFAEVMKHVGADATMFELGGFWAFYSIWFLSKGDRRRSFVVEPDPKHMDVGRANAHLNGVEPVFIPAFAGRQSAPSATFVTEASGPIALPCVSVPAMMDIYGIERLDVLHCDAQGIELSVLESCANLATTGRLSWVIVSTHSHQISKDPLTHQRCLATLLQAGAVILAEHDVQESFSGDGLIVAKFGAVPPGWRTPRLTYNRSSESLFRNPLYDLATAITTPPAAAEPIEPPPTSSGDTKCLTTQGELRVIMKDCALGLAGDRILLPFDQVMFPRIIANNGWALEALGFLEHHIDPCQSYAVLDIGANIGLFTRQLATRFANIGHFICVEAEPENFRALQYNVASLLGERGALYNVALSHAEGQTRFFRDRENFGNYSLNDDAMRDRPFDTVMVKSVAADRWLVENVRVQTNERLIWKSDTQGYDELIISLTPLSVWDRIDAAIIELWRINKPDFDEAAFRHRIDSFPNKSIGLGNRSTTAEIIAFLSGNDWHHDDLFLWR